MHLGSVDARPWIRAQGGGGILSCWQRCDVQHQQDENFAIINLLLMCSTEAWQRYAEDFSAITLPLGKSPCHIVKIPLHP